MASEWAAKLTLQFPIDKVGYWATRYVERINDKDRVLSEDVITSVMPGTLKRHAYGQAGFLGVCRWKSPRAVHHCATNSVRYIDEVTTVALAPKTDERLRIKVLTLLNGVSWPTASALLHFGFADPFLPGTPHAYPIIDFRALESLGLAPGSYAYDFNLWWKYVEYCRTLATKAEVSMRELDRALWQHSKERPK